MLRFGVCGLGFMGRTHLANIARSARAQVVAVHDIEPDRLSGPLAPGGGNLDVGGRPWDESRVRRYGSVEELLSADDIDAVVVAVPSFLHADVSVAALAAGKSVFCEKPMALSVADCDRMISAAKKARRTLMVGHCIRFWGEYASAAEIVRSGRYGPLRSMLLTRMGGYPGFGARNWFADADKSGGAILDLHIHDTDYAAWVLGKPRSVQARGYVGKTGGIDHVLAWWDYGPDGPILQTEGSWVAGAVPFEMAFRLYFRDASLAYSLTDRRGLQLYADKPASMESPTVNAYEAEMDHFISCALTGKDSPIVPPASSRLSVALALAERESIRTAKCVPVD